MAYCVAHLQKFKAVDVRGLEIHINRESKNNKNKDIVNDRTKDNINVLDLTQRPGEFKFRDRIKAILSDRPDSDKKLRKDAVVICSVVVSASPEYFKGKTREQIDNYFITAANFLQEQFAPALGGYVHYDEQEPHMHYLFCPKTIDGRICAKDVVTRASLTALQDKLPKYLQERGYEVERGVKNSPRYHVDTSNWKRDELILEATKEQLMKDLSDIKPTRGLNKCILSDKNFEKLKGIADQSIHAIVNKSEIDKLEREKQAIQIIKTDIKKQEQEILQKMKEQEHIAESLTAREINLADRERRNENYKKILEAQDKNIKLQELLDDAIETRKILEQREKDLAKQEKEIEIKAAAAIQRVREAAKIAVMEEVKKQGKESFWKTAAMNELQKTNPEMYDRLVSIAKRKSLNRVRKYSKEELKKEK